MMMALGSPCQTQMQYFRRAPHIIQSCPSTQLSFLQLHLMFGNTSERRPVDSDSEGEDSDDGELSISEDEEEEFDEDEGEWNGVVVVVVVVVLLLLFWQ